MKRIWLAVILLLLIFSVTFLHSWHIQGFTQALAVTLEEAESHAEQGDWAAAEELTRAANERWRSKDFYLHVTMRHNETDAVYAKFREVGEFIQCQESGEYSAANAGLIAELELLAEAEQLTLKNIF